MPRPTEDHFELRLAATREDIRAAQHLRYRVFVQELGGDGAMVDHDAQLEMDAFDPVYDHLLLLDRRRGDTVRDRVVGVYRLMRSDRVAEAGRYYCEDEYDLSVLKASGRRLLELGRSCVDADYRGGTAMLHLWSGLARYVADHDIDILFGVASFHGTDIGALKQALSFLYHNHLAPEDVRVRAVADHFQPMDLLPPDQIDRKEAVLQVPALIKGYLRLGGTVGDGAFIDHAFNTTDVCLIMDTARMTAGANAKYKKGRA
ncbi:GNAT family N-acetyltransferase [Rhodovulum sp. FJ3]|uniref:GNAT family N-acetyltransferase n=1 Tax=Rhodovulum sp. FJ3 TaxID=3079053 RepID=UPI00293DBAB9|nr:GNAT family N-acyltransferase [Rhodovulum sp. FJ3]MDV4168099.1 GNAT family N-acyltransferase [Rhodovulum sp. FJ3]